VLLSDADARGQGPALLSLALPDCAADGTEAVMAKRFFYVCAGLLCLVLAASVSSAAEMRLTRGSRIRIEAPDQSPTPLVGSIMALTADSLVMRTSTDDRGLSLPLSSVKSFEFSRGRKRGGAKGAGVGFLVGAGGGGLALLIIGNTITYERINMTELTVGALGLGAVGALLGLVVGSIGHGQESWKRVEPSRVRVVIAPDESGTTRLGVSVGF
jgi:hypothetical protein